MGRGGRGGEGGVLGFYLFIIYCLLVFIISVFARRRAIQDKTSLQHNPVKVKE